ncbi:MAG: sensor histidine kinase [Cyclobacteriaceae bacterium]|nr:sensor histidine kinase [Cyclobacteriaceae bacterium]
MGRFFQYKIDHVLFWLLTVFFHGFTHSGLVAKAGFSQFLLELSVRNGLLALVIYFNLLIVIPRLNLQKKYVISVLLILLSLVSYALLKNLHDIYLYGRLLGEPDRQGIFHNTFYNLSIGVFYLAFAITLHLSKEWYIQRERIRQIEIEKLNTELEYLKAQMNPHFLFNSLNTVYFQIDKQNMAARETLSKVSDMLRYQLYECNGEEIAVEKEVRYLKNYVELQKLRKDENYQIQFTCSDDLKNFTLPPLLLLPFIENAFKHVSHHADKNNKIEIKLCKTDSRFIMQVFNTKDSSVVHTPTGGIGLKNVKRRLELLYKDRYQLDITESAESFTVFIKLQITT